MAKNIKNVTEKVARVLRWVKREAAGESNRVMPIPEEFVPLRFFPPYANFYRRIVSDPAQENRLEFAVNSPVIEGDVNAVRNIRKLDTVLGKLATSFNARSLARAKNHVADIQDSLSKVSAYIVDNGVKKPVNTIEYAKGGKTFLKIKLG